MTTTRQDHRAIADVVKPHRFIFYCGQWRGLSADHGRCDQVSALSKSCLLYIRQLRTINNHYCLVLQGHWYTLLFEVGWTTVTACLPVSVVNCYRSYKLFRTLPARPITGARKCERMTPVLCKLHWLPIRQWITFKTAVLAYKCQHGSCTAIPAVVLWVNVNVHWPLSPVFCTD